MKPSELRQLNTEELHGKIRVWREDIVKNRFQSQNAEKRDTNVRKKLRREIARALTILNERQADKEGHANA